MNYEIAPVIDWRALAGTSRVTINEYFQISDGDPSCVIVVPRNMPTWLRLARRDLTAIHDLDRRTVGELRETGALEALGSLLGRLYATGILSVGGNTGVRLVPAAAAGTATTGKPKSLLIKMTGACDIACDYCYDYDPGRWRGRVDLESAKQLISACLDPRQRLTVMFHGGEPLLQFEAIRALVEFAESEAAAIGADVLFSVQTNGLRLDRRIVDYLEAHGFGVGISLDGPGHVHDLHRVDHKGQGTFERLAQKFKEFPEFMCGRVGYISVVTPRNLPFMEETWQYFCDMGVQTWKMLPQDEEGRGSDIEDGNTYIAGFTEFLERRIREIIAGRTGPPYLLNVTQLIAPLVSLERRNMCMKMPCGAANDLLVLDAANQLRGCDCTYHPAFLLDRDEDDLVGGAFASDPAKALLERERWLMEEADCRSCPWLHYCAGTCVARALASKKTLFAVDDLECRSRKRLFPIVLSDIARSGSNLLAYYGHFSRLSQSVVDISSDLG
jgi:uncharacterized protein